MIVDVSPELLAKYEGPGPRYTSYPTAPSWRQDFTGAEYAEALGRAREPADRPLSMYVHLPFCESMCFYCGCNVVITQRREKGVSYVDSVLREADLLRTALPTERRVAQHHWGGGTPTFLPPAELRRLFEGLTARYPLEDGAEVSIEVDPRVTTREQLETLRACGFNRISMGVQDFDPKVQETIHRVQSYELTRELVDSARELGFWSVNLDLVYGLPFQTVDGFEHTLGRVLELGPDRLACYGYAHVPWLKKHQRVIPEDALPRGKSKLDLYLTALRVLRGAGYEAIGMDHFAKPEDSLVQALHDGHLHRNFMGYTTRRAEDMVALGVTAISEVAGTFAQNHKELAGWNAALQRGELPIEAGLTRSPDDEARRAIILDLMCRFRLRYADHGGAGAFRTKYENALAALEDMRKDGLCELDDDGIRVTDLGRLFVRNLCMPFDAYLRAQRDGSRPMFSKTV